MFTSFPFAFWRGESGVGPVGFGYRYGYEFDGVDEYIDLGNVLDNDGTQAFSLSIRFKYGSNPFTTLFSKYNALNGFYIGFNSSSNIDVYFGADGSNRAWFSSSPNALLNSNTWYNVVYTYDGSKTVAGCELYLDGVKLSKSINGDNWTSGSSSNSLNAYFGRYGLTPLGLFDGRMDDVQYYDFVLNSTQVSDIYNSGYVTAPTAGPIHHWKLGEEDTFSTNWTVKDSVGSLDGTSVNMEEVDRKLGVAYSLQADGVDELVNFGDINFNDGSQDMSFSFWVSGLGANMANGIVFGKEFAAYNGYRIWFNGNRKLNFTIGTNYTANQITNSTGALFNDLNAWYHCVIVFNSTRVASDCKIYVNNVESSGTINDDFTNLITDTGADFEMFNTTNGNFQHLNGAIMEFAKFDTILSASDVSLLFNETGTGNGVPIDPRNVGLSPTFYCPMVGPNDTYDGTNWTITDEIAGNNGTSVNMEEADKTSETP